MTFFFFLFFSIPPLDNIGWSSVRFKFRWSHDVSSASNDFCLLYIFLYRDHGSIYLSKIEKFLGEWNAMTQESTVQVKYKKYAYYSSIFSRLTHQLSMHFTGTGIRRSVDRILKVIEILNHERASIKYKFSHMVNSSLICVCVFSSSEQETFFISWRIFIKYVLVYICVIFWNVLNCGLCIFMHFQRILTHHARTLRFSSKCFSAKKKYYNNLWSSRTVSHIMKFSNVDQFDQWKLK